MEHEMKMMRRRVIGAGGAAFRSRAGNIFMALLTVAALSCSEPSSEVPAGAAEGVTDDEVHADLPADPRREATAENPSAPWEGTSGIPPHEHEPKHGGVIRSIDVYHVELTEDPIQVWVYDRRGKLLPVEGLEGQIVVYSGGQRHPYTLVLRGDHLTPVEPVDLPDEGSAFVELSLEKQSLDVAYDLPLGIAPEDAAG